MGTLHFLRSSINKEIPLNLLTIGTNQQPYLKRTVGLPYHQIFLTVEGQGVFRLSGIGDFELLPGEVIIIPSRTSHEYFPLSNNSWELSYVGFDGNIADTILSQFKFNNTEKISSQPPSTIQEIIEQLWAITNKNESDSQWRASESLYKLLLELKRLSESTYGPKYGIGKHTPNKHILETTGFIRAHYSEQIKISHLANIAGYSTHHFTRLFREIYQMTPHQYIKKIRFEKAKFLLEEESDLSISEIANKVGMEENYFIRLFKKRYGMTPGVYRMKF